MLYSSESTIRELSSLVDSLQRCGVDIPAHIKGKVKFVMEEAVSQIKHLEALLEIYQGEDL